MQVSFLLYFATFVKQSAHKAIKHNGLNVESNSIDTVSKYYNIDGNYKNASVKESSYGTSVKSSNTGIKRTQDEPEQNVLNSKIISKVVALKTKLKSSSNVKSESFKTNLKESRSSISKSFKFRLMYLLKLFIKPEQRSESYTRVPRQIPALTSTQSTPPWFHEEGSGTSEFDEPEWKSCVDGGVAKCFTSHFFPEVNNTINGNNNTSNGTVVDQEALDLPRDAYYYG